MSDRVVGVLQLPQADFTGLCNDLNPVRFEVPVEASCLRRVEAAAFAEQCEQQQSVTAATSMLLARHVDDDKMMMI